jgi:glycosyltransferase involved in cell wall biosynthesis
MALQLPKGVKSVTYLDNYLENPVKRLLSLRYGGAELLKTYRELYKVYPNATIIVRHHMHVLSASRAGYSDIRYLVPSLTKNQLRETLPNTTLIRKISILVHMLLDGWFQTQALAISKLFVFSLSMQNQVRDHLPSRHRYKPIRHVRPGIDSDRFKPANLTKKRELRVQLGLPKEGKIFLFVGRFVKGKGLDYLLDSFSILPSNCSLVLLGEGELESSVRDKIKNLGITKSTFLPGRTSLVECFYRACDVFVMSSTYEPFGQTILEAAACGLQIAAFGRETGVLTATHELGIDDLIYYASNLHAESLAASMSQAMNSATKENSWPATESVLQANSWSALVEELSN